MDFFKCGVSRVAHRDSPTPRRAKSKRCDPFLTSNLRDSGGLIARTRAPVARRPSRGPRAPDLVMGPAGTSTRQASTNCATCSERRVARVAASALPASPVVALPASIQLAVHGVRVGLSAPCVVLLPSDPVRPCAQSAFTISRPPLRARLPSRLASV
jgi:hypothetical protein